VDVTAVSHTYDGIRTVNGTEGDVPIPAAAGDRVRLRVVNTDNAPFDVWSEHPVTVLAVDATDLNEPSPVTGTSIEVTAGGRVDLGLTVPQGGMRLEIGGSSAVLVGPSGAAGLPEASHPAEELDLLSYGEPAPLGLDPAKATRHFEYSIGRRPGFLDGRPGMWWTINGHMFPNVPMYVVREGDVVVMEVENHSGEVHPMHLHGHHAVVLSRNGEPAIPVVGGLARRGGRGDLRDRLRRGQPGRVDGPLPQPPACRRGPRRTPDVRGRAHAVPGRRARGERAGVRQRTVPRTTRW
jgi:FtsP/CotA-like multicopper oxidase with cupredoxin domain